MANMTTRMAKAPKGAKGQRTSKGMSQQALRIIGGQLRGRVVRFAALPGVRPTPDRVRETLFNWLGQGLAGMTTLEPYAGSGVLSLESLSRGARLSVAADAQKELVQALAHVARSFNIKGLEVHCARAEALLAHETRQFNVIFLDPPFAENPWPWLFEHCAARLVAGGWLYAESGQALAAPEFFELHRQGRAGQVHYYLFRRL